MTRDPGTADTGQDVDYAVFARPCVGERVSGDTTLVERRDDLLFIAIVDVLGHGPQAHAPARAIRDFLQQSWQADVVTTLNDLHAAAASDRGAAAGLCTLDCATGRLQYAAVGNTVLRAFERSHSERRLLSVEGIVGEQIRRPRQQSLQLTESTTLMLYTDGVKDRFKLEEYPQLVYESPWTVARQVVERFGNRFDDATCLVLRWKR